MALRALINSIRISIDSLECMGGCWEYSPFLRKSNIKLNQATWWRKNKDAKSFLLYSYGRGRNIQKYHDLCESLEEAWDMLKGEFECNAQEKLM